MDARIPVADVLRADFPNVEIVLDACDKCYLSAYIPTQLGQTVAWTLWTFVNPETQERYVEVQWQAEAGVFSHRVDWRGTDNAAALSEFFHQTWQEGYAALQRHYRILRDDNPRQWQALETIWRTSVPPALVRRWSESDKEEWSADDRCTFETTPNEAGNIDVQLRVTLSPAEYTHFVAHLRTLNSAVTEG